MSFVPKNALLTTDDAQERSKLYSRAGLTTAMRVRCFLAYCRYFVVTGWLSARSEPKITTRSVPMRSDNEQVGAPMPSVAFSPETVAAWRNREQRSTLLVPSTRASFWNT